MCIIDLEFRDKNQRVAYHDTKQMINSRPPGQPVTSEHISKTHNRRGSRISARGGRQGIDDFTWDGDGQFLTYASTDLQLLKMFIAILCLNGVEQPFKRH